jgi:hypothetical protein
VVEEIPTTENVFNVLQIEKLSYSPTEQSSEVACKEEGNGYSGILICFSSQNRITSISNVKSIN